MIIKNKIFIDSEVISVHTSLIVYPVQKKKFWIIVSPPGEDTII